mgnify:FL=1
MKNDVQEEFLQTYLEYFKAYEEFLRKPTVPRKIQCRKLLSKLKKLAHIQRIVISEHYIQYRIPDGRVNNKPDVARQIKDQKKRNNITT